MRKQAITAQIRQHSSNGYKDKGMNKVGTRQIETGKIIGNISVVQVREDIGEALIGYCMSREYWGHEYMPEALKAVIDYLFDVAGMNRVVASHDVNNPKSGRVMQKAGMKYEGTLRQAGHNMQGIVDLCYYSVIKSDREQQ